MHDVRLRRLFDDLGRDDMKYTVGQVYYASMRKDLRRAARPGYGFAVSLVVAAVAVAVCGIGNGWWIALAPAGLLLVACVGYVRAARAGRFNQLVRPPLTEIAFARTILGQWRAGYGQGPPGLVRESATKVGPNNPDPVLAVLCTAGRLTDTELDWLGKGWWSPIAALRPVTLMRRVGAAADRLGDPARRTAATVGFLTWPEATREAPA